MFPPSFPSAAFRIIIFLSMSLEMRYLTHSSARTSSSSFVSTSPPPEHTLYFLHSCLIHSFINASMFGGGT